MGLCDYDRHEISILKGMNDSDTLSTLIHEVLHVIGEDLTHGVISRLEVPLASLFFQLLGNP